MTEMMQSETVRVPCPDRYSLTVGVDSVYVKCRTCHERKKSSEANGLGWIFAFESRSLTDILGAVIRHEEDNH